MHNNGTIWGRCRKYFLMEKSLKYFFSPIKQIIDLTKSKSLIDFGCGKAKFYFNKIKIKKIEYKNVIEFWNIQDYFLYDPGVDEFSTYPNIKTDGVLCIDVVEHIPPEDIMNFIDDIFHLAKKFVFIVISCYEGQKTTTRWKKCSSFYQKSQRVGKNHIKI